jgi:predicted RNase H-like HicB family nuclease
MRPYQVNIERRADTGVWCVVASDVPGLTAEAASFEALLASLESALPELLGECHSQLHGRVRYRVVYDAIHECEPRMANPVHV